MGEHEKTIAKKFFVLLYLFLRRKYKNIDVVFIRHTHEAKEVDEETFFHSPESGGTLVSTAYDEMLRIIKERYPVNEWNLYMAQASDGDNTDSDNTWCTMKLGAMLPWLQYVTYVEVGRPAHGEYAHRPSNLWTMMDGLQQVHPNLALRKLNDQAQVIETFRSLFQTKAPVTA
jgi:uncharacterized sporulation protein YeaH/YhbH (DUF444 family)